MRIVLTGGGTGGHLVPFEPLINALREVHREKQGELPGWIDRSRLDIYFVGVADNKTKDFFSKLGIKTINIPAAKLRRYPSPRTFSDFAWRMPTGFIKSLWQLWLLMPEVIISKGGYGSLPVIAAGMVYRIPYLIHESDVVPGLTTRLTALGSSAISVGFSETRKALGKYASKTVVTGTPVRSGLGIESSESAKKLFGFEPNEKVLLAMGGSQGAEQINEILLETLPNLIEDMGIIHIAGEKHLKQVKKAADELLAGSARAHAYKARGFIDKEMGAALKAADVVVSRAGATSLAELARLRKVVLLIPLAGAAQDHQRFNARAFEVAEAARVLSAENLGRSLFEQNIRDLMEHDKFRQTLSANISRFDHPNAARDMANLAFKLSIGLVPRQPAARKAGHSFKKKDGHVTEKK